MAENKETVENKDFRHIIRLINTDIDGKKSLFYGMNKIMGIGPMFANAVCRISKLPADKKIGDLSEKELEKLTEIIENPTKYGFPAWMLNRRKDPTDGQDKHVLTSDLKFITDNDIKMMKKIKSFKGIRHMYGLPVRGQSTRSKFRKNKGKTLGVIKKSAAPAKDDKEKDKKDKK